MSALLQVEHIEKSFGQTKVLKDVSFSLNEGEVVSIIGSSGSGKTTLLRCLNFLETPDSGVIKMGDEVLLDMEDPSTLKEETSVWFGIPELQLVSTVYGIGKCYVSERAFGEGKTRL